MRRYDDYDPFARIYSRHWGGFSERALPVLDRLLLRGLPSGACLLDVCCGAGHMARLLAARGYRISGVDGSEEMVRRARENAPGAEFLVDDVRAFSAPEGSFDGAYSLYDSLNHLPSLRDLTSVFRRVREALRPAGRFVFDLNMEEGYRERWHGSLGIVEDDYVCVVRTRYDVERRMGANDVTLFERDTEWRRNDFTLTQRCYGEEEVRAALAEAGFADVCAYEASRDLRADMGVGRMFFTSARA